jgi:lysophospholipase L1-like esterase
VKKPYIFILFFLGLLYFSYGQANPSNKNVSILFVGNSLTYTNNLPKLVKQVAEKNGVSVKTEMIAYPNYAIIDHWNDGDIRVKIAKNKYDYVIVQQGPSSQQLGKEWLLDAGKKLAELCEQAQTKLCFFMVWPALEHYQNFDDVIKNYREAALVNKAILCPVGEVWKAHFEATGNFDYYDTDGFHPSLKGSEAAAEIIVSALFPEKSKTN